MLKVRLLHGDRGVRVPSRAAREASGGRRGRLRALGTAQARGTRARSGDCGQAAEQAAGGGAQHGILLFRQG
eukprot:8949328-Pyramimonas_sp.AAC.1